MISIDKFWKKFWSKVNAHFVILKIRDIKHSKIFWKTRWIGPHYSLYYSDHIQSPILRENKALYLYFQMANLWYLILSIFAAILSSLGALLKWKEIFEYISLFHMIRIIWITMQSFIVLCLDLWLLGRRSRWCRSFTISLHVSFMATSKLAAVYVGDNFEMLVTDSLHWKSHQRL